MKRINESCKSEKGTVMLEGVFASTVTIIVMTFMISLGIWLYQVAVTRIVANEVAEEVSTTYKLTGVTNNYEIKKMYVTKDQKYRYTLFALSTKVSKELSASRLANNRIKETSLEYITGKPTVTVERKGLTVGRALYKVTVSYPYEFFGKGLLNKAGYETNPETKVVIYANSIDVSDYFNSVRFGKYAIGKLADVSKIVSAVDSIIGLLGAFNEE